LLHGVDSRQAVFVASSEQIQRRDAQDSEDEEQEGQALQLLEVNSYARSQLLHVTRLLARLAAEEPRPSVRFPNWPPRLFSSVHVLLAGVTVFDDTDHLGVGQVRSYWTVCIFLPVLHLPSDDSPISVSSRGRSLLLNVFIMDFAQTALGPL